MTWRPNSFFYLFFLLPIFADNPNQKNRHEQDEYSDDEDIPIDQAGPLAAGDKRPAIYNADRLHEILEDFAWTGGAAWAETQAVTAEDEALGLVPADKVDDDITRELAFYSQALEAAREAVRKFKAAGVPWFRPPDYYAEMVKSDGHMARVKQQLVGEQRAIQEAEERRKQREAKKYSKQVQAEKNKEKARNKKKEIEVRDAQSPFMSDVDRYVSQIMRVCVLTAHCSLSLTMAAGGGPVAQEPQGRRRRGRLRPGHDRQGGGGGGGPGGGQGARHRGEAVSGPPGLEEAHGAFGILASFFHT